MKRLFQIMVPVLLYFVAAVSLSGTGNATDRIDQTAPDPLNATYRIKGNLVALVDGLCESPAAPGSAMKVRTAVWKEPVYGDLDGDGDEDAALVLIHDPGGSGTFYYVAAAVFVDGRYQGTNSVLLGDRIAPMDLEIHNRQIVVNYADRHPDESFSRAPSVDRIMALAMQDGQLLVTASTGEPEQVTRGEVTIGHEVRSFKPCDGENELWLMGQSPALKAIMTAYHRSVSDHKSYRPLFMVLAGKQVDPPTHGFGADYEGAFLATRLVRVAPEASCGTLFTSADSAVSIRQKITFDISALDDQGLLGPPGGKRALSYEFCIPDTAENKAEVAQIDPTIMFSASSGRIGCRTQEILCIGFTHQKDFATILRQLAELSYVQRIDESVCE